MYVFKTRTVHKAHSFAQSDFDYRAGSISLAATQKMLVLGNARIHVVGTTRVSASAYILLGPNSSFEWYGSGDIDIGGAGCINSSGLAQNFSIIGLSSSTSIRYSGTAPLIGTIYGPTASVTIVGNSDATAAVVGNTVTLTGDMGLHFDESLPHSGPFY